MQTTIHPEWYPEAQIVCACGNMFTVGSSKPTIRIEICNRCHPYFTGEMKFVDTKGRVEKFQAKVDKADETGKQKVKKKQQVSDTEDRQPKTLKEMLMELQK